MSGTSRTKSEYGGLDATEESWPSPDLDLSSASATALLSLLEHQYQYLAGNDQYQPVTMSEAYERERQNNARLEELSAKVSSLRGVTVDIYDNARAHDLIENTVCQSPHEQ